MGLNETELFSGYTGCSGSIRLEAEKIIGDVKLCKISLEDAGKINELVIWIDRLQGMIDSSMATREALIINMKEVSETKRAEIQKNIEAMMNRNKIWKNLYEKCRKRLNTLLQEISAQ